MLFYFFTVVSWIIVPIFVWALVTSGTIARWFFFSGVLSIAWLFTYYLY